MDHREPDPAGSRRFARLVPAEAVRKLALSRMIIALVAGLVGLLVVGSGFWYVGARAVGWVTRQDAYQVPFHDITLSPPPPAWFRGGSKAFLDHVRAAAMIKAERVPVLDGDLARLALAFQKSPWVRSVAQVRNVYPRQIIVTLQYREPVAIARSSGTPEWLVDRDGVILPAEGVNDEARKTLVALEHLGRPHDPRPGRAWQIYDDAQKSAREDPRASAAGRLASFLRSSDASRDGGWPPPVVAVLVGTSEKQLFVQFEPFTRVRWGKAPGSELPDEPGAVEKWHLLQEWFRAHPDGVERSDYLSLSKRTIVIERDPGAAPKGPLSRASGGLPEKLSR
ncbi:MAG: hypothetical protein P4L84_09015 [Isosphaeraceae bacterium]|nr:hypothetical protein [Isosphaeraceae bacterium]